MKKLISKHLGTFIGILAATVFLMSFPQRSAAQALTAQLTDKEIPVSEFNSLQISDDFDVTLSRGSYGVRLTVDKDLAPYVEVYVKAKTLYLSYDEKAVPKEIRKLYKGKGGLTPIFRVVAYAPELRSLSLSDNASFSSLEEFTAPEFELTAVGKSQVKNLTIKATSAKIMLRKNATAVVSAQTEQGVEVSTENSSNLKLTCTGHEMVVNAEGSSVVIASGPSRAVNVFTSGSAQATISSETEKVNVTSEGSSKVVLTGRGDVLNVKGSRSSNVDAYSMPFEEVVADLSGSSSVTTSVSRKVDVTLVGGSSLYYSGAPEFRINKIVKSTLAPYGTK
jgi:hypothetical protein